MKSPFPEKILMRVSATMISPVGPTVTADINLKVPFLPTYNLKYVYISLGRVYTNLLVRTWKSIFPSESKT